MFERECLLHMDGNGLPFRGSLITDGEIHRFSADHKQNQKDEWYAAHTGIGKKGDPYLVCTYGSWSTGAQYTYRSWENNPNSQLDREELHALQQRVEQREQEVKALRVEQQAKAAQTAKIFWDQGSEVKNDHYLLKKGVKDYGLRHGEYYDNGALLIPLRNVEGELRSLQYIYRDYDGTLCKRFLSGGEKHGNFHQIGEINHEVAICEGYATGASWNEATGMTTIIAFDSGNLEPVIAKLRQKHPSCSILIVGDDDVEKIPNVGREKALEAASLHGCLAIFPQFPAPGLSPEGTAYTDFNDLHAVYGIEEVQRQLESFRHSGQIPPIRQCQDKSISIEELERQIDETNDFNKLTGSLLEKVAAFPGGVAKDKLIRKIAKKADCSMSSLKQTVKALDPLVKQKKNQIEIAREVIEHFGPKNIVSDEISRIWKWQPTGVWSVMNDKEIKQVIHRVSGGSKITKNTVDSILDLLRTETFIHSHRFDLSTKTINCMNGELELVNEKWELKPHCLESYRTTQIPYLYDPEATAPRFEQFLNEIFEQDSDKENKMLLVCEFLGYSLLSSCNLERFLLLIGNGCNGKSVLLSVVEALLGANNTTAVQPSQFDNRFQRAHLQGKLANIVTEISEGSELPDAQLKAIISGEKTTAEHKHKAPFDFHPFCTCWFGTNHLPYTRDFSEATFRRAVILTFNQNFEGDRKDIHLSEKLKEELPGILNLALKALSDLLERKEFTICPSSEEAKSDWRLECDQVTSFVAECCELNPAYKTASKDIYKAYLKWAQESGLKRNISRNSLTTRLRKFGVTPDKGSQGKRLLFGIRLNPNL